LVVVVLALLVIFSLSDSGLWVFLSDAELQISSFNYLSITARKRNSKASVIMMSK